MRSNSYIITFVTVMTVIVALVLSLMSTGLKPIHERNEAIFNKKAILSSIESKLGEGIVADKLSDDEVLEIFDNDIEQLVVNAIGEEVSSQEVEDRGYVGGLAEHINMADEKKKPVEDRIFPLFVYKGADTPVYIMSIRGTGLWDEIWGNVALQNNLTTVVGASFDHKGETPGLGAEIKDNTAFRKQFAGKNIYDTEGNFTSVVVRKGGAQNTTFEVDGISGATVTCDGVTDMLFDGIQYYMPYFNSLKRL